MNSIQKPSEMAVAAAALSADQATDKAQEQLAKQVDNQTDMQTELTGAGESRGDIASKIASKQKSLAEQAKAMKVPKEVKTATTKGLRPIAKIKASADEYSKNNPALKSATLTTVRDLIKGKSKEEILDLLKRYFPDAFDTHQVLQFLLDNLDEQDTATRTALEAAQIEFDSQNDRAIKASEKILTFAENTAGQGIGSTQSLRDLYQDVKGNPRDAHVMFRELKEKYKDFENMEKVFKFMFNSLGADLKKNPEPALLQTLVAEVRTMEAIRHTYLTFKKSEPRMEKQITNVENPHYVT